MSVAKTDYKLSRANSFMTDVVTKKIRSRIMARIKGKNTKPEILLRKALYSKGLRYRTHYGDERIDIAFPSKRLAIFVDGCFWHMCPVHRTFPKSNKRYWLPKLRRNMVRDKEINAKLRKRGWRVIRLWEHEINEDVLRCARRVIGSLRLRCPP